MSTLVCFSSLSSKFNLLGPPFTMKRRIKKIKQPPQYPGVSHRVPKTLCLRDIVGYFLMYTMEDLNGPLQR